MNSDKITNEEYELVRKEVEKLVFSENPVKYNDDINHYTFNANTNSAFQEFKSYYQFLYALNNISWKGFAENLTKENNNGLHNGRSITPSIVDF
jgi:hypothetical protein